MTNAEKQSGFTLIELMTVTAIVGLLLSLAVPAFERYRLRTEFSNAILAANEYKLAIDLAANQGRINSLNDIRSGINGIPGFKFATNPFGRRFGDSPEQEKTAFTPEIIGVFDATIFVMWPLDGSPLQGHSFILQAENANPPIRWTQGGSCMWAGYC